MHLRPGAPCVGKRVVGIAAAIVAIVSSPRLYNTTKIIVPVVAILFSGATRTCPSCAASWRSGRGRQLPFSCGTTTRCTSWHRRSSCSRCRHGSDPGGRETRGELRTARDALRLSLARLRAMERRTSVSMRAPRCDSSRRREGGRPRAAASHSTTLALLPLCGLVLACPFALDNALDAYGGASRVDVRTGADDERRVPSGRAAGASARRHRSDGVLAAALIGQAFRAKRTLRLGALVTVAARRCYSPRYRWPRRVPRCRRRWRSCGRRTDHRNASPRVA